MVEGQVAGNDVDFFRFHGKKGQMIVVDAQCARIGSGIDPTIRLTTAAANRAYVASADDSPGLLTDARLTAVLPADGDYVVELSDSRYQGASRPVYRLVDRGGADGRGGLPAGRPRRRDGRPGITGRDLCRGQDRRGDLEPAVGNRAGSRLESRARCWACASAPAHRSSTSNRWPRWSSRPIPRFASRPIRRRPAPGRGRPVVFNGRIDPPGDDDRFVAGGDARPAAADQGASLRARLGARRRLARARQRRRGDRECRRHDHSSAAAKASRPQSLVLPDPSLEFTVPGGTNEITLVDSRPRKPRRRRAFPTGSWSNPFVPTFSFWSTNPRSAFPGAERPRSAVTVQRKGYSGPITVTVADPPAGLTVRPGTIAAGQTVGVLSLSAAADASFPAAPIKLVGRGQGVSGPFERLAFKPVVYAQQTPLPTCTIKQFGLVAAPALAAAVDARHPPCPDRGPSRLECDDPGQA